MFAFLLLTAVVLSQIEINRTVVVPGRMRAVGASQASTEDSRSNDISSPVGGIVSEVNVGIGSQVASGDLLLKLDTAKLDLQIAAARRQKRLLFDRIRVEESNVEILRRTAASERSILKAELALVNDELSEARILRQEAEKLAESVQEEAAEQLRRTKALYDKLAETSSSVDAAQHAVRRATIRSDAFQREVSKPSLLLVQRKLEGVEPRFEVEQAKILQNLADQQIELSEVQAALEEAEFLRMQCSVLAMREGIITDVDLKPGNFVEPGPVGIRIVHPTELEFVAEIPTGDVAGVCVGLPTEISFDGYRRDVFGTLNARITFLAPDSTIRNQSDSDATMSYTAKMAIPGDGIDGSTFTGPLKRGLEGTAEIIVERTSILSLLFGRLRKMLPE